ncbi:Arylsulfatase [Rubripirellula tenax]|uniref:Arylsulfatase n=1 Tax=Rubripirellula tenax TaxID=2528015 RepID=A0A5C6EI20_9BACT|nr:arylsulfatase [Rubripirellula tenax]TWU48682.1 Arylsulfatase [Rubripirellula tenax]
MLQLQAVSTTQFKALGTLWNASRHLGHRVSALALATCAAAFWLNTEITATAADTGDRPNVVVIMVDDLGYSDIGCYGSEIETPNLDRLAEDGLRFSQFYNTAKCHSSRVSLLTGQYCNAAGNESLANAVTSAEVLAANDYTTMMTGKWHLDREPTDLGFSRYFGHLSGACNYFLGDKTFRLDGEPFEVPNRGFYTTVANIDYALEFLDDARDTDDPWYLYVAFNAPHAPLQALPDDYEKYEGVYESGWDVMREARVEKQLEIKLLENVDKPSPRPEHIPAWDNLTDERRDFEVKRMQTLAAMIDRVDQEIGRLMKDLEDAGELDNTLIWFVSDNGACPYDRHSDNVEAEPTSGNVNWSDSTGWAWARNSPFRYYKQNQFEGGISTPAIVHWPDGLKTDRGSIHRGAAHLIDVMPTLAEVSGSTIPTTFEGRDLRPVSGQSLLPIFQGGEIEREQPIHFVFAKDRGLRDGDWKAVSFKGETWELYNVKDDRIEMKNLADAEPERLTAMVDQWMQISKDVLHATRPMLAAATSAVLPHHHPEWTNFDTAPGESSRRNRKKADPAANPKTEKAAKKPRTIRARKNTEMEISDGKLNLTFTGDDPGLAIDRLPETLPAGPYVLAFRLRSNAKGDGELFFTADPEITLPDGTRVEFPVDPDNKWHEYRVRIQTTDRIDKLRLDICDGPGNATIEQLRLTNETDETLVAFP